MKQSLLAEMNGLLAEQEALHWANVERTNNGFSPAYDEHHFWRIADRLKEISEELKELAHNKLKTEYPEKLI